MLIMFVALHYSVQQERQISNSGGGSEDATDIVDIVSAAKQECARYTDALISNAISARRDAACTCPASPLQ